MILDSNAHSVFSLHYQLVFVVKYRRNVFDNMISEFARDMFVRIGSSSHITLVQWNHDKDHVHIMFKAHPKTELTTGEAPIEVIKKYIENQGKK